MKHNTLRLFFLTTCIIFLPFICAGAQESVDLPEIKGSHSQDYQELRIEVTKIMRMEEFQPFWQSNSNRARGRKVVAKPGFEIALVSIHTKRLSDKPASISVNLYIYDVKGNEYVAHTRSFTLGIDPKEEDYKFPVEVPKGTQFSAVQLRHSIIKEVPPFVVSQKITFNVSEFSW